jgi:hypothetical protein
MMTWFLTLFSKFDMRRINEARKLVMSAQAVLYSREMCSATDWELNVLYLLEEE